MQSQQSKTIAREVKELEKEIKNLASDIATLEEKLPDAIRGDFAFSVDKLSAIIKDKESRKNEVEIAKKKLKKQLEEISVQSEEMKQFIDLMPKWNELFRESDTQTKQMLISTLVDKIIVKDEEITIKFKIRLEDYMEHSVPESGGSAVPRPGKEFYHHLLHGIRSRLQFREDHL